MSPLANGGRPKKRERMRGINGEECGKLERVGILERILEFGKLENPLAWRDCREAKGLCLVCGSGRHMLRDCLHRKFEHVAPVQPTLPAPVRPALPAPPLRRNPEPVDRRAPFPPQQYGYQQREMRPRADQGRGQGYIMAAEASKDAAECGDQCPGQEP